MQIAEEGIRGHCQATRSVVVIRAHWGHELREAPCSNPSKCCTLPPTSWLPHVREIRLQNRVPWSVCTGLNAIARAFVRRMNVVGSGPSTLECRF